MCVCARVWARMRVRALVHAGVCACVYMHALFTILDYLSVSVE